MCVCYTSHQLFFFFFFLSLLQFWYLKTFPSCTISHLDLYFSSSPHPSASLLSIIILLQVSLTWSIPPKYTRFFIFYAQSQFSLATTLRQNYLIAFKRPSFFILQNLKLNFFLFFIQQEQQSVIISSFWTTHGRLFSEGTSYRSGWLLLFTLTRF